MKGWEHTMERWNHLLKGLVVGHAIFAMACSQKVGFGFVENGILSVPKGPQKETFGFNSSPANNKVDVLMVVDNSASMAAYQDNLSSNFNAFMSNFLTKGYDFHLAVTTTDAYLAGDQFRKDPNLARFRDGAGAARSGVSIITDNMADPLGVFALNSRLGVGGSGDERAFASIKAAISSPLNQGFLRDSSFLAVIILSDEDDFSHSERLESSWNRGGIADHSYDSGLESVDSYVSFLDSITRSSGSGRRYNVNAITVADEACLARHRMDTTGTVIGRRYMDMVAKTEGVLGSICEDNFSTTLNAIGRKVVEDTSSSVNLKYFPVPQSLEIAVSPYDPNLRWEIQGRMIRFNRAPNPGTNVEVRYVAEQR